MTDPAIKPEVEAAYDAYPSDVRDILYRCRKLVFEVVQAHPEIGPVTETLKWGVPSYLTEKTKSGSTLRLATTSVDGRPTLFVNCKTDLVDQFREIYPKTFRYQGVRALVLDRPLENVEDELKHCIALTLTYHLRKKKKA